MIVRPFLRGLLLSAACLSISPASAEIHAIVAGFNDYHKQPLKGAVADALDISAALKKRGVTDLTVLTGATETVEHFKKEWAAAVSRAKRGDWIIFSFAGHGIREREKEGSHLSRDGFDKGIIFPAYDPDTHPEDLLRDEVLYDLFKATSEKGIKILFIVDACHAGTGIRGTGHGAVRAQDVPARRSASAAAQPEQNLLPRPKIASVAVLSGQIQSKSITELTIGDQPRGAMSYAVARGIDGGADSANSGTVTVDGLWRYVRKIVQVQTEHAQEPVIYAREEDGNLTIFKDTKPPSDGDRTSETAGQLELPPLPDISLFSYVHPDGIAGAKPAASAGEANIVWDAARGIVSNPAGDRIALGIDAAHLQGAVDARRLLIFLQQRAAEHGALETNLHLAGAPAGSSNNANYGNGEMVEFEVEPGTMPYLLAFDLNADGTVQFLYPLPQDSPKAEATRTPMPDLKVKKPFGGDYMVFIRSEQPLTELAGLLLHNKDGIQVRNMNETLRRALAGRNFQIGIQGLFTCEKLEADRQCVDSISSAH